MDKVFPLLFSGLFFFFSQAHFAPLRHVVKLFQVFARPLSVPPFVISFMEANESSEVRSTGTPPTANGGGGNSNFGGGASKTSTDSSPAGSKILSKNSNGTSE